MEEFDKKLSKIFTEEKKVPEKLLGVIETTMKMENKNKVKCRIWLRVAVALPVFVLLCVTVPNIYAQIKWNIEYKEFENRPVEYGSASIKKAIEEGNEKNVDMEYVYHDNIGVKLDSLLITDDFFSMNVDFSFPKEMNINTDTFTFGYAIYDENKNVYGVYEGALGEIMNQAYWKKLYKEEGIGYNPKDVFPSRPLADKLTGGMVIASKEGNMKAKATMQTPREFPRSKKLFIRIFNIGYIMSDYEQDGDMQILVAEEKFRLTDTEWKLEVEVPDDFYKRETISLVLEEEIKGFELKKLDVTETGTNIIFKMDGFNELVMSGMNMDRELFKQKMDEAIYITDETGKRYSYLNNDNGTYFDNSYKAKFDITKDQLNKKFYLHVKINGEDLGSGGVVGRFVVFWGGGVFFFFFG